MLINLWFCLLFQIAPTVPCLEVHPDLPYMELDPYLSFALRDKGIGNEDFASLEWQDFQALPTSGTNFGAIANDIHLRFTACNPSGQDIQLYLETAFPQLDLVIYEGRQSDRVLWRKVNGDDAPIKQRNVPTATLLQPVEFPPGETEVRIYVRTTSSASVPLYLGSAPAIMVKLASRSVFNGVFYGIATSVTFFAVIIFIVTREKIYFYFSSFAASTAFLMACFDGYAFFLWPESLYWQHRSVFVFVSISMLYLSLFSRKSLEPWKHNSISDRLLRIILYFQTAFIAVVLFLPMGLALKLTALSSLVIYSFFSIVAITKAIKGQVSAYFYLASFLSLLLLGIVASLTAVGNFGSFHAMREVVLKLANGASLLLFSLGLAWRVRMLKAKEEETKRKLLIAHTESQTKSEFLAQMSHELRTPLNAIIGMSDILAGTKLEPTQKKYLDIIQTSSNALLSVINSILDYSRLEANRIELAPQSVQVREMVHETVDMFKAQNLKIDMRENVEADVPQWIMVDPHRLRQIFLNLLANAVKFTAHGSITLQCSMERHGEEQRLRFEVLDTGIGIPKNKQASLFNPFTQADASTARKYGGTGLGLSICRQLVELMGGEIGVVSTPDVGSCFWFKIPCVLGSSKTEESQPQQLMPSTPHNLKVLVVEDNKVNIKVITHILKREAIDPDIAERGAIAIKMLKENTYDLILMDCEMPEMDGYQTTQAIRKWECENQKEPTLIYALSAHALEEHRQRSTAVGMDGHLSKPIQIHLLREVLNLAQTKKNAQQEG